MRWGNLWPTSDLLHPPQKATGKMWAYQLEKTDIALILYVQMAPPRWTMAAELLWLQNEVPTYLQMQKEKKIVWFFELLYPKWFSVFPEHLRVWPREPSENSPDKDTEIDKSGLDLANDEVNTELDHENSVSDREKLSQLDAEQTEVLNAAIKHRHKVRFFDIELNIGRNSD